MRRFSNWPGTPAIRRAEHEAHDEQRERGGCALHGEPADRALQHREDRPQQQAQAVHAPCAEAVEQPAARNLPDRIGPRERGKDDAELHGRQPEVVRDAGAGDRHRRAIRIVDDGDRENQREDRITDAADRARGGGDAARRRRWIDWACVSPGLRHAEASGVVTRGSRAVGCDQRVTLVGGRPAKHAARLASTIRPISSRVSRVALARCGSTTTRSAEQFGRHVRLVREHVEAGAGDRAVGECANQRGFVDQLAACDIDQESGPSAASTSAVTSTLP